MGNDLEGDNLWLTLEYILEVPATRPSGNKETVGNGNLFPSCAVTCAIGKPIQSEAPAYRKE